MQEQVHDVLRCGQCGRELVRGSLESTALEDSFCSEACYTAAWKERKGVPERRGAIPAIDDGEEFEATPEEVV